MQNSICFGKMLVLPIKKGHFRFQHKQMSQGSDKC